MDAHTHPAAEPAAEQNGITGLAMGLGIVGQLVALVGAVRGSTAILDAGALLAVLAIAAAIFGLGTAATGGKSARGSLVAIVTSVVALLLWLTTQAHI